MSHRRKSDRIYSLSRRKRAIAREDELSREDDRRVIARAREREEDRDNEREEEREIYIPSGSWMLIEALRNDVRRTAKSRFRRALVVV